jgi:hypothetical protein
MIRPTRAGQRLLFASDAELAFNEFCERCPEVFERLKAMALALKARGFKKYGLRALWEAMRYDASIQTGEDPYKLNNNLAPFMARKLMAEVPGLESFFETRSR